MRENLDRLFPKAGRASGFFNVALFLVILLSNMMVYALFKKTTNQLLSLSPLSEESYHLLKFYLSPTFQVALSSIYLYFSRRASIYRIVERSLIAMALISAALYLFLPAYIGGLAALEGARLSYASDLMAHWLTLLFYLASSSLAPLLFLLFYGYLNTITTFSRATALYPALSICTLLLSEFIVPKGLSLLFDSASLPLDSALLGLFAAGCFVINLLSFRQIDSTCAPTCGGKAEKRSFSPLLLISLLFLSLSFGFSRQLSLIYWCLPLHSQEERIVDYWRMVSSLSSLKSLSLLLATLLLIFLSVYLKEFKLKGWKTFSLLLAVTTNALIILLLGFDILSTPISSLFSISDPGLVDEMVSDVGGSYQIFINTLAYPLLLCLKNLIYLPLPDGERFRYMVIVELSFHRFGYFAALAIQQALNPLDPFKTILLLFLVVISSIVLLLSLLSINLIAKRVGRLA